MSINSKNMAILGPLNSIGSAFTKRSSRKYPQAIFFVFSRNGQYITNYSCEDPLAKTPEFAEKKLLKVLESFSSEQSGKFFIWNVKKGLS